MSKFNFFPKNESYTQYGKFDSTDANMIGYELENAIKDGKITTNVYDNNQLSKSISNRIAQGNFFQDITKDYLHIQLNTINDFRPPTEYFDGMICCFLPKGNNKKNATISISGLGEKKIRETIDKDELSSDVIKENEFCQLIYNQELDCFIVFRTKGNSAGMPIGSVFSSALPIENSSFHLLNGDLLPFDGAYSSFYNYIKTIYDGGNYNQLFVSEEEYQQQIANNGNCANFVFEEGVGVRLPTINGWIKGITSIDDLGTLSAELSNIKGTLQQGNINVGKGTLIENPETPGDNSYFYDRTQEAGYNNYPLFNASLVNSIYKDGARVQPDGVAYFTYIVVANGLSEDEITVDINNVLNDLQNKVDKDGSNAEFNNLSTNAKDNIKILGNPDWSKAERINVGAMNINNTYTFSDDGILYIFLVSGLAGVGYIGFKSSLDVSSQPYTYFVSLPVDNTISLEYRVQKNETITLIIKKYNTLNVLFLPLKKGN